MRVIVGLVAVAACYAPHPQLGVQCGPNGECPPGQACIDDKCGGNEPIDAPLSSEALSADATSDGTSACATWGVQRYFDPCKIPPPMGDLDLVSNGLTPGYILHTDTGTLTDRSNSSQIAIATMTNPTDGALIVSVSSLEIESNASLRVDGPVPVEIASWSTITITGGLDVSGHRLFSASGAGSNPSTCSDGGNGGNGDATDGAGGGGGGGGNQLGGYGGAGSVGTNGLRGLIEQGTPTIVQGGCDGGHGGMGGGNASFPGDGGGGVHLDAMMSIAIAGTINASGAGGKGGFAPYGGGGGGGAGGYVGLEAPTVTAMSTAIIVSNGGAGGGGADDATGNGSPGQDGQTSTAAAIGGAAGNVDACATAGANGGNAQANAGVSVATTATCGGGGGGAATGYMIKISGNFSVVSGAVISPAPHSPNN
jgi:hypothetical protein